MITIVDYGRGNIFSITQALSHLGAEHIVTDDPQRISEASKIILPGVGAFGDAMAQLDRQQVLAALHHAAGKNAAILGICLGMQLFATTSEEFGTHAGLNLIPGTVRHLPAGSDIRIPNVGWRQLESVGPGGAGIPTDTQMYFVHSYGFFPEDTAHVAAIIEVNGQNIPAIVRKDRLVGCQFHPEKSGSSGLRLLRWFLALN